jgi:hypothetical protein
MIICRLMLKLLIYTVMKMRSDMQGPVKMYGLD